VNENPPMTHPRLTLTFATAETALHEQLLSLLRSNGFECSVDPANAVSVWGAFTGDAHDLVVERLYDPVFGQWCLLECDDEHDTADMRRELLAKGIPFIEECVEGEHGFVLSSANSPV
jgi:hypothetical protein